MNRVRSAGEAENGPCADWSSAASTAVVGSLGDIGATWSYASNVTGKAIKAHLYCVEDCIRRVRNLRTAAEQRPQGEPGTAQLLRFVGRRITLAPAARC